MIDMDKSKSPSHNDICPTKVGLGCIYCEGIKDGRNQTLADVEKIIDEEGEIIPCGNCNTFGEVDGETNLALDGYDLHTCEICEGEGTILVIRKNVLKEEIKNLKDNHSSNLGGVAENQIGVSESIRVANSKQSTVPETHSKQGCYGCLGNCNYCKNQEDKE